MEKSAKRILLALLISAVTVVSIVAYSMEGEPHVSGVETSATLIINFGTGVPSLLAGEHVTWRMLRGHWNYTAVRENGTQYSFEGVSFEPDNVWSLMMASSHILYTTTGHNLTVGKTYYPEYSDYFITSIMNVSNANGLYWQYTINGTLAEYGVLHQTVADGAVVEWSYEPYAA